MEENDLNLVSKAMAMDLSNVINWNKDDPNGTSEIINIYGSPTPTHVNPSDVEYWKDISSKIFYVGKA